MLSRCLLNSSEPMMLENLLHLIINLRTHIIHICLMQRISRPWAQSGSFLLMLNPSKHSPEPFCLMIEILLFLCLKRLLKIINVLGKRIIFSNILLIFLQKIYNIISHHIVLPDSECGEQLLEILRNYHMLSSGKRLFVILTFEFPFGEVATYLAAKLFCNSAHSGGLSSMHWAAFVFCDFLLETFTFGALDVEFFADCCVFLL